MVENLDTPSKCSSRSTILNAGDEAGWRYHPLKGSGAAA